MNLAPHIETVCDTLNRPSKTCLARPHFKVFLSCTNLSASVSLLLWCTEMQNCSQNICQSIRFPLKVGTSNVLKFIPPPSSVGKALCTDSWSRCLILKHTSTEPCRNWTPVQINHRIVTKHWDLVWHTSEICFGSTQMFFTRIQKTNISLIVRHTNAEDKHLSLNPEWLN